jgi:hypothetical protein
MLKRFFPLVFLLFCLGACSTDVPEYAPSRKVVMEAQQHFSAGDYASLESLFSEDFARSESAESRKEKFEALRGALGAGKSVEVLDSSLSANAGEIATVTFTLMSKNERINSTNRYRVVKEGSQYKIAMMDIRAAGQ